MIEIWRARARKNRPKLTPRSSSFCTTSTWKRLQIKGKPTQTRTSAIQETPRTITNPGTHLELDGEHPVAASPVPPAEEHTVARESCQRQPPGAEAVSSPGRKASGSDGSASEQGRHGGFWTGSGEENEGVRLLVGKGIVI